MSIHVYMQVSGHTYINLYGWTDVGRHVCMHGWVGGCR